jgi:carboxymethylenebutenolidase
MSLVQIQTADGTCPSHVFRPAGQGPWPAVLVFMDGVGIRPAMLEIGERLAASGYFALLPDLFYRAGPYAPMDARTMFTDPEKRKAMREMLAAHVSQAKFM